MVAKRPKIAMIGAGSVVFAPASAGGHHVVAELAEPHIAVMDINADRLAVAEKMAQKVAAALGAHPHHRAPHPQAGAGGGGLCDQHHPGGGLPGDQD